MADESEMTSLLAAQVELLQAMPLVKLGDLLLSRATSERPLTQAEERDARLELDAMREAIEQLDAMLLLRRQQLRPM